MIGKPFQGELGNSIYGMRTTPMFQDLETRMGTMSPSEEAVITGRAYAAIRVSDNGVTPGAVLTVTLSGTFAGSPVVVPVTAQSGDDPVSFCQRLAAAFAGNAVLIAAGFQPISPWGAERFTGSAELDPEMAITNNQDFSIAIAITGSLIAYLSADGSRQPPVYTVQKRPLTNIYGYLPICNQLEGEIAGSSRNLEIAKAETAVFRGDEQEKREELYIYWVNRMAEFMGLKINDPSGGYGTAYI